jgi:DNA-binding MarR family transcriptional regulator
MNFDTLVANAGRLRILVALCAGGSQDFVQLRRGTKLTDGNLSAHAKRLAAGGLVRIEKSFREGKPVTTFVLTEDGRRRLAEHVNALTAAVERPVVPAWSPPARAEVVVAADDDDWVD